MQAQKTLQLFPSISVAQVRALSGQGRTRRMVFFAMVRDRHLSPLGAKPEVHFDKHDNMKLITFDLIEAVNLQPSGHCQYTVPFVWLTSSMPSKSAFSLL